SFLIFISLYCHYFPALFIYINIIFKFYSLFLLIFLSLFSCSCRPNQCSPKQTKPKDSSIRISHQAKQGADAIASDAWPHPLH
ncbi:hypothetical protein VIGAN_09060500, partial [Vigna angularis var. angularis]